MGIVNTQDSILEHLKDIYDSEVQFVDALSVMIEKSTSDDVKRLLQRILDETQQSIDTLSQEGEARDIEHSWVPSEGFAGMIRQNEAVFNVVEDALIRDLEILMAAKSLQAVLADKYENLDQYLTGQNHEALRSICKQRISTLQAEHPEILVAMTQFTDALG